MNNYFRKRVTTDSHSAYLSVNILVCSHGSNRLRFVTILWTSIGFEYILSCLLSSVQTHFVAFNFVTTKASAKIRMIISILRVPSVRMLQQNMHKTITQVSFAQMASTARTHSNVTFDRFIRALFCSICCMSCDFSKSH